MIPARYCSHCHGELPPGASADDGCPRCLLALGMAGDGPSPPTPSVDPAAPEDVVDASAPPAGREAPWTLAGRRLGGYRIRERLGGGGMGRVYAAEDTRLGRTVALKVLPPEIASDPDRLARFRREARALAALDHPGIVTTHAIEEADGLHVLIMERVEGRTVAELIPEGGMSLARLLGIALPLAEALGAAHRAGVVHRNLKPGNVMVDGAGRVKLLDFGLARHETELGTEAGLPDPSLTRQGVILGTLPYLSPEQVQGRRGDRRSDQFSLGVLLFEMATGRRPFRGEMPEELLASIRRDEPPRLRDLRPELPGPMGEAVSRCLEKAPERRHPGMPELLAALRRAADGCAFGERREAPAEVAAAVLEPPGGVPAPES